MRGTCSPSTTTRTQIYLVSDTIHTPFSRTHSLDILRIPLQPANRSLNRILGLRQSKLVLFRLLVLEECVNVGEVLLGRQAVECVGDESREGG
jgi:hypothetical protein